MLLDMHVLILLKASKSASLKSANVGIGWVFSIVNSINKWLQFVVEEQLASQYLTRPTENAVKLQ